MFTRQFPLYLYIEKEKAGFCNGAYQMRNFPEVAMPQIINNQEKSVTCIYWYPFCSTSVHAFDTLCKKNVFSPWIHV